ncbi:putative transposase-like protein [Lentibacillus sp. JNUCC-1]|uniref:IS3 family transposase n=1 Tax=Lentibacillus sp. JNUCC-1 TaxID=2654513 RepID=UPI0012E92446|nr:putative transposase-like protein [Lentibacillus sp. JNUCC-1]
MRHEKDYRAIECLKGNYSIELLCEVAGVGRSAYYKWRNREDTPEDTFNKELLEEIQELYQEHDKTLGYRRMALFINRRHEENRGDRVVNEKRIYRLMGFLDIEAVIRRKRKVYTPSTAAHTAENLLDRDFTASKPNEKWLTDVTEFKYGEDKKAYLSAILDLYDNRIVRYTVTRANNNELAFDTINRAIESLDDQERPLLHTDRGVQYTSYGYKRILEKAELRHSMSRPGKCIDNGPMEGFWGTIKSEKYYLQAWRNASFNDLSKAIDKYIHYYNNERFQLALGGLTPFEKTKVFSHLN